MECPLGLLNTEDAFGKLRVKWQTSIILKLLQVLFVSR